MRPHKPQVINRHHYPDGLPSGSLYVGRGTPLGNPFRADEPGCLDRFAAHLKARLDAQDPAVMAIMTRIDETTILACSCAPRPCHADVIANAWAWLMDGRPGPEHWTPSGLQGSIGPSG